MEAQIIKPTRLQLTGCAPRGEHGVARRGLSNNGRCEQLDAALHQLLGHIHERNLVPQPPTAVAPGCTRTSADLMAMRFQQEKTPRMLSVHFLQSTSNFATLQTTNHLLASLQNY